MYTHILVPLDGSALGERALPVALALAQRSGARIELVHAHERNIFPRGAPMYDTRLDNEFEAEMRRELEQLAERLHSTSRLPVSTTLLGGRVTRMFRDHVATSGADLMVMTTHGYGGLSRAWLGSVSDHLVRHSNVPVLLVRPGAEGSGPTTELLFRRILVPLDGSPIAETAVDHAVTLGTPGETEYTLLQVVIPPATAGASSPYPLTREPIDRGDLQRRQHEAEAYLDRVRCELTESGFVTKTAVVVHHQIARGILEHAHAYDADLIALVTRGRGAMPRGLLGSVAEKILRAARTPLLLYHPPSADDERRLSRAEEARGAESTSDAPTAA